MKKSIPFKSVVKLKRRTINIPIKSNNNNEVDKILLYSNKNLRIREQIIKALKNDLINPKGLLLGKLNKLFYINVLLIPNKVLTLKGILVRMGKGKGKINTKALYITEGMSCIYIQSKNKEKNISKKIIEKLLDKIIKKYTFLSYKYLPGK